MIALRASQRASARRRFRLASGRAHDLRPAERALELGRSIAEDLAGLQCRAGGFEEATFYGVETALALWGRCDAVRYASEIDAASRWMQSEWRRAALEGDPECHWEFKLYACTSAGLTIDPGLRRDNRRVLNWQLLLAVVDLRLGSEKHCARVLARVAAHMDAAGRIADFDRSLSQDEGEFSDQYHAFAALLLDELARRSGDASAADMSARASAWVIDRVRMNADPNQDGRGRRQVFGYAAMLRLLLRLGEDALAHRILDLLDSSRWPSGRLPLCLDDAEDHFRPQPGWHGYNRWFDYSAWLGLHCACDPMELPCLQA